MQTGLPATSILLLILLSALLGLSGCNDTTSVSYDESRINDILYDIEHAYNEHDIDALMNSFHVDYKHSGMLRWEVRELWLDRMSEYQVLDILDIDIEVNGNLATVSFTLMLQSPSETVYSDEPATSGDLSYFVYDNSDWQVYGNQLSY